MSKWRCGLEGLWFNQSKKILLKTGLGDQRCYLVMAEAEEPDEILIPAQDLTLKCTEGHRGEFRDMTTAWPSQESLSVQTQRRCMGLHLWDGAVMG